MRTKVNLNFIVDEVSQDEAKTVSNYDVFTTKIGGINFNCDANDSKQWGLIAGYCLPDPYNEFDNDAIAIYDSATNKKLGYIPKDIQQDFIQWNKYRKFPFVGKIVPFVTDEGDTKLSGIVHFIRPFEYNQAVTNEEFKYYIELYTKEIQEDLEIYNENI